MDSPSLYNIDDNNSEKHFQLKKKQNRIVYRRERLEQIPAAVYPTLFSWGDYLITIIWLSNWKQSTNQLSTRLLLL